MTTAGDSQEQSGAAPAIQASARGCDEPRYAPTFDRWRDRLIGRAARGRRAYVLVAVLTLAALATALGVSYLEAHSTAMPEAMNYRAQVRAQYLADSGVAMAAHFLMYPPSSVAYGQYWPGQSGVSLDGSADVLDVSVAASAKDPNRYTIASTGVARDPDGSLRAKRGISADVIIPVTGMWEIPYAFVGSGTLLDTIPSCVSVTGHIHSNASIDFSLGASFTGSVYSTGTIRRELVLGIFTNVCSQSYAFCNRPAVAVPAGNPASYQTYTIKGKNYTAYTLFTASELKPSDADILNAIDMSGTNPGRIVICKSGTFKIRKDVNFYGTLVVNGRLDLDDTGPRTVTAVPGFPALVVNGSIQPLNNDMTVTVNGSVICNGAISGNGKDRFAMTVNGAAIVRSAFSNTKANNNIRFIWDRDRATFWDFDNPPAKLPFTLLNWKEQ